jgi:hypothetical protein
MKTDMNYIKEGLISPSFFVNIEDYQAPKLKTDISTNFQK